MNTRTTNKSVYCQVMAQLSGKHVLVRVQFSHDAGRMLPFPSCLFFYVGNCSTSLLLSSSSLA